MKKATLGFWFEEQEVLALVAAYERELELEALIRSELDELVEKCISTLKVAENATEK